jgi:hypothetical protein
MSRFTIPVLLLVIFFFLPLQVFIIGTETGIGIQGAVYRYQITGYGTSLIPVMQDLLYVTGGTYSGKTALSIILWVLGTVLLTITTWAGLVYADGSMPDYNRQIGLGLAASCICYLFSCIAQYGFFFHGPPGTSLPIGVILILAWLAAFRFFPEFFRPPTGNNT